MLTKILLALSLSASAVAEARFEPVIEAFAGALRRDDLAAVTGSGPRVSSLGTARDFLFLHDDLKVHSYRLASVETNAESTLLLVELDGSAITETTHRHVAMPRWWSLEVRAAADGSWELVSAMTLERRLGAKHAQSPPEELAKAVAAHPQLDFEQFSTYLANAASGFGQAGCPQILWILRESQARGDAATESLALQMLSYFAVNPPMQFADAFTSAERALLLARADGRPTPQADSLFSLGIAQWLSGSHDAAIETLVRSASYFEEMDDPRLAMRSQYMAAQIEFNRLRIREALALEERHLKMLERLPSTGDQMDAHFALGTIHGQLGNPLISRRHFDEARAIAKSLGSRDFEAMALHNIAMIATTHGSADEGRRLLEEAWEVGKDVLPGHAVVVVLLALGAHELEDGDYDRAEVLFNEALAVADKHKHGHGLAGAHAMRSQLRRLQGRLEEALADARQAHAHATANPSDLAAPLPEAVGALALALRDLGQHDAAEAALREAIDAVEAQLSYRALDETGGHAVLRTKLAAYRELLDLLASAGCGREALVVAEQMRARSLRDTLRRGRVDLSAGLDAERRQREEELERDLATINRDLLSATDPAALRSLRARRDEARLALRSFQSELYLRHPEIGRRRPESVQPDTWQPAARDGEIVVELAVTDREAYLFIIRGVDVAVRRLPVSRDELERRIDAFMAAIEQRDLTWRKPARALYDLLFAPIENELASAASLRIVPDGALWRLPFHALLDSSNRHLGDRVTVAYAPSLALASAPDASPSAPRTLLALGDPVIGTETAAATRALFRDVPLGRLPEAATEARTIARLYEKAEVRVGHEATESLFKEQAPAFRVLHVAAHSIVDDSAPMFSSIVLASKGTDPLEDGLLEAREIAGLDLRAGIAVLSACDTARGAVSAGEGVIGLSWAFLAAGVPTTVVSQWKVGSASTAGLMIAFHRRLRDGAAPAAALRAAMTELRRDPRWRHPFYWAPFVVLENSGAGGR